MSLRDELESFRQFAYQEIEKGDDDKTLESLMYLWRFKNPPPEMIEADRRAIAAAIRDYENGDRGRPLEEFLAQLRTRYNLDFI